MRCKLSYLKGDIFSFIIDRTQHLIAVITLFEVFFGDIEVYASHIEMIFKSRVRLDQYSNSISLNLVLESKIQILVIFLLIILI